MALQNGGPSFLGNFFPRGVQIKAKANAQILHLLENPGPAVGSQGRQSPIVEGEFGVRDDFVQVDHVHMPQTATLRTGAFWGIEAKGVGFRLRVGNAGGGAHEVAAKMNDLRAVVIGHHEVAFAQAHRGQNALFNALFALRFGHEAVNHDFNIVRLVPVQTYAPRDVHPLAVHTRLQVALLGHGFKELAVMPLSGPHDGGEQRDALSGEALQNLRPNLIVRVADHGLVGRQRIGRRGARVEQAQEVVDLCDGADRGSGISVGGLLLNGNDRTQAFNAVYIGALHGAQKLTGIAGKRLHVAALALRIQGVKGQRGLSRTTQARDDHQGLTGQGDIHIVQVVLAGTEYFDFSSHGRLTCG